MRLSAEHPWVFVTLDDRQLGYVQHKLEDAWDCLMLVAQPDSAASFQPAGWGRALPGLPCFHVPRQWHEICCYPRMISLKHHPVPWPVSWCAAILMSLASTGLFAANAQAQAGKALGSLENICLTEARRAEAQHSIPSGLLQSITRVEAGRKTVTGEFMPWAWTLNDAGEGLYFDSREAAMRHLEAAVAAPGHSVDVGCMQVNTKWHMEGFHNLSDMLDPVQNADYAAGFLLDLHEAHQSWDDAVKHYHSSEPAKNVAYHGRVLAELERFLADDDTAAPTVAALPGPEAADLAAESPLPVQDDAELALIERPVTVQEPRPAMRPVAPVRAAVQVPTSSAADRKSDDLARQPNLAPHRDRVEHFRQLLARQSG